MSWAPDLDSQPWARALTWQGRAVTGPQFCGPRAPDIHALQAVIRTPAGLPGGRWPPCPPPPPPLIFVSSSLCLSPVLFLLPCSGVSGAPPRPQTVSGRQWDFSISFQRHPLAPCHSLSGFCGVFPGEHLIRHSGDNAPAARCKRLQKTPGSWQGRRQFRLSTFPSSVQCDH